MCDIAWLNDWTHFMAKTTSSYKLPSRVLHLATKAKPNGNTMLGDKTAHQFEKSCECILFPPWNHNYAKIIEEQVSNGQLPLEDDKPHGLSSCSHSGFGPTVGDWSKKYQRIWNVLVGSPSWVNGKHVKDLWCSDHRIPRNNVTTVTMLCNC